MKDGEGKKRRKTSGGDLDGSLAESMAEYTPEQREALLKGLRILARVAVRAYLREQGKDSDAGIREQDQDIEE